MELTITERGVKQTVLGPALQIKVFAPGYPVLTWREVWEAFATRYPGKWAIQVFPSRDRLLDAKNVYHLFVLNACPTGLDLR